MLDKIANKIQTYSGKPPVAELRKAAVLIAVTESNEPELIYTLRSNKVGTHGGEVSFPGGMYEKEDVDLENTALREREEEAERIGLQLATHFAAQLPALDCIGGL